MNYIYSLITIHCSLFTFYSYFWQPKVYQAKGC